MKTSLTALSVLASILGFGWLIFSYGGRPGDVALGFLSGVVFCVFLGTYFVKSGKGSSNG